MKVMPPRSRERCSHPQSVTVCPAFCRFSSPQVFVLYIISKYIFLLLRIAKIQQTAAPNAKQKIIFIIMVRDVVFFVNFAFLKTKT
jgi:hypothetical protein